MRNPRIVHILALCGETGQAERIAEQLVPGSVKRLLTKRELREGGWRRGMSTLRRMKGEALVVYLDSVADVDRAPRLIMTGFAHGCRKTVFADRTGGVRVFSRWSLVSKVPRLIAGGVLDLFVLLCSWLVLPILGAWLKVPLGSNTSASADVDLAYLYPVPLQKAGPGGEMSYIAGTLSGLQEMGATCDVYSSCALPSQEYPTYIVPGPGRFYLFREAVELFYNLRFFLRVRKELARKRPRFLYQRHCRFVLVGGLLSRWLRIPLIVEYQCSEVWRAKNWDPMYFVGILARCEDLQLRAASGFVALSTVLKQELLQRGISASRIVLNPAGVDPNRFCPGCGGDHVRNQMRFTPEDIVVTFVGSFSYWHGVFVLQESVLQLLRRFSQSEMHRRLRFLLVGDGLLRADMERAISETQCGGRVVFTGVVPHDAVPGLLDASDILVSPHMPAEAGKPFFGSPSKLFEYMAVGKAIVASELDQLADVLRHGENAWLVPPGDAPALTAAIERLAADPALRKKLGSNARAAALQKHCWRENAARLLAWSEHGDVEEAAKVENVDLLRQKA